MVGKYTHYRVRGWKRATRQSEASSSRRRHVFKESMPPLGMMMEANSVGDPATAFNLFPGTNINSPFSRFSFPVHLAIDCAGEAVTRTFVCEGGTNFLGEITLAITHLRLSPLSFW